MIDRQYQSEQVNELAEALAKAQGEMGHAKKDSTNPHFRSSYADFTAVVDALKVPLQKNGLSYAQVTDIDEAGNITMITTLMHKSGQWLRSYYPIRPVQATPQGLGSSLTYGKRYSLAAIVGVAAIDEDDDGNAASASQPMAKPQPKPAASAQGYRPANSEHLIELPVLPDGSLDYDLFAADLEAAVLKATTVQQLTSLKMTNGKSLNRMKADRPELFGGLVQTFTDQTNKYK